LDPELPPVPALPGEINQVLLNLIVNAAHAIGEKLGDNPTTKGTIKITTRHADSEVEVRVSDTGTGIPEGIHNRIFDPFFTTKDVGKGTGQGLAIVRSVIVDKHGGTVRVESRESEGTTFILRLPTRV
ncbi:MAG: ATP-binding protein, partial [Pirellulaceae bacterium]